MEYEKIEPISRTSALEEIESGDQERICRALVRLAFHDEDGKWLQDLFLKHLDSDDVWVRGVAAICFGHVARIHGWLDLELVVPRLKSLLKNPATAGKAADALDDIDTFIDRSGT